MWISNQTICTQDNIWQCKKYISQVHFMSLRYCTYCVSNSTNVDMFGMWHVLPKVQLLPFPFPCSCYSVMWVLCCATLSLWPTYICICPTFVTHFVISLLVNAQVQKALSVDIITCKPCSNLLARLCSLVIRSIVNLTQTNYPMCPAPEGQIENE